MSGNGRTRVAFPPRDPGAQPERTWFAWRRTTLSFVVVVALAARVALVERSALAVVAAACGALAWLAMLRVTQRRIRALSRAQPEAMGAAEVRGTLLSVLALIVVGVILL